jgi:hypothetical protein
LISIRFIPDEYIYYIASAYGVFGIILLILAIIGGTLLILNSYFPIKEHKAFGVVWALFYFFIAWGFHQLTNISTGIYQVDELLPLASSWGKYISIVLGLACLYKAFSGRSKYARRIKIDKRDKRNKKKGSDKKKDLDNLKKEKNKAKKKEGKIINDRKKIEKEDKSEKEKLVKEIVEETKKQIFILKKEKNENLTYIAQIEEGTKEWLVEINRLKNILKEYYVELKKINYEIHSMHNEGLDGVPGRKTAKWGTINIEKREKIQKEINETNVEMEYEKSLRIKTMKLKTEYINRNKQITDELREISYSYKRQVSKVRESE